MKRRPEWLGLLMLVAIVFPPRRVLVNRRSGLFSAAGVILLAGLAACTSAPASSTPRPSGNTKAASTTPIATPIADSAAQPPLAAYACTDGSTVTIRNLGTSIRIIGPNGMEADIPAMPANQRSRYGEAHEAIVLDGREALIMQSGSAPLTCTR